MIQPFYGKEFISHPMMVLIQKPEGDVHLHSLVSHDDVRLVDGDMDTHLINPMLNPNAYPHSFYVNTLRSCPHVEIYQVMVGKSLFMLCNTIQYFKIVFSIILVKIRNQKAV